MLGAVSTPSTSAAEPMKTLSSIYYLWRVPPGGRVFRAALMQAANRKGVEGSPCCGSRVDQGRELESLTHPRQHGHRCSRAYRMAVRWMESKAFLKSTCSSSRPVLLCRMSANACTPIATTSHRGDPSQRQLVYAVCLPLRSDARLHPSS